jgi:hypothetical protein
LQSAKAAGLLVLVLLLKLLSKNVSLLEAEFDMVDIESEYNGKLLCKVKKLEFGLKLSIID